jgi:hypothetical protein
MAVKKKVKKKVVKKKAAVKKAPVASTPTSSPSAPKPEMGIAVVALILNLIIPGIGSLVGRRTKEGTWQLIILFGGVILGILLTLTFIGALIGIPLMIIAPTVAWVWGVVTGIQLIMAAS